MAHQSTSTIMAIESLFYHHGVLCASYPLHVLTLSIVAIVVLSWPVVLSVAKTSLSSPNYEPIQFWDSPSKRSGFQESRFVERFGSTPHLRLEQIVFNASSKYLTSFGISGVLEKDVLLEALDLQTRIEASSINYHPSVGLYTDSASNPIHDSITLSIKDICFLASNGKCLVHSPLEFWKSNSQALRSDPDILRTLSNSSALSSFQTPIPLHSVFGGVILNHEHTSNSPPKIVGASSIVITYFLEERRIESILSAFSSASPVVDENLISRIFDNLWVLAVDKKNQIVPVEPLTDISHTASFGYWLAWRSDGDVKHLYYVFGEPEDVLSVEMVIVLLTYIIVFFYISLVLGKVELVKSKFGLGLGAVLMVFSSLTMSVGLTSWMGVTSSLVPWEVLPFLIIAIGVENIRVITNAVVTSAIDLPVKERVGIGLSKVGAKMAYSLARELCLLVLVSLINVPALQEFCLFATVAVVIDFMMQITFFTTILSIDIRRLELSDLPNLHGIKSRNQSANPETDRSRSTTYSSSSRWGAITMAIIMAAIGFGVYGTTSQPNSSIAAGPIESPLPIWENSVSVTADVLWEVINPTQIDQYVEIRPPIYVTLSNSQKESPTNPAETQSKQKPSIRKERWTITIDNYSFEIPRSVFIVVFVGLIVLICLGVIMLSSLIYYLAAGVSTPNLAQMKSKRNTLDDTQKIIPSAPVEFKNAQVISLVGSSILDVEFLDCSSDGTAVWSCRDGYVHIWNCRTSRKIVLRDGCETSESKNSGDGISAFRLSGQYLIIGTYLGVVRVWDTYHGKLLSVLFNKKHRSAIYDVIIVGGSDQYLCAVRFDGSLDGWSLPIKLLSSEEPFTSEQATFTAEYLKATPSCLSIEFETILAASNEGLVKLISPSKLSNSTKSHQDTISSNLIENISFSITAISYDTDLDILVLGSSGGDISIYHASSKKEILFIKSKAGVATTATAQSTTTSQRSSMDLASSRPSFDSEASTGSRNSTSESKKEIPRVSPLLEGHSGEVTFLKVLRKDASSGPPASTLSPLSAALGESGTYCFLVISSGVDSVVNVWEVYVMKPKPQQHVMSIHSSTLLKTVSQPGCVVATCFENMLVGARRKRSGACQKEQESGSSGLRNRRKDREESFGWWEVWVLDLTGLYSAGFQASSAHSEDGLVFVNIGEDNLSGIVLDSAATGFLARKERRLKRALAIIERRRIDESDASASEDSSDDEWVDNQSTESADRGCSTIIGDDSLVSLLPVFGINLLAASKWGVVCGFGNFLKVVYLDLSSPELKRVSSGMFSKQV